MNITPDVLKAAVFSILHLAIHETDVVYVHELEAEWPSTGLRHSDFKPAIGELEDNRLVTLIPTSNGAMICLTPRGVSEYYWPSNSFPRRVFTSITLARLRLRHRLGGRPQPRKRRRRRDDRGDTAACKE